MAVTFHECPCYIYIVERVCCRSSPHMDGLSGAASIIAVIDISAKIASLCFQYSVAVKDATEDIERLQRKFADLNDALGGVKQLLDGRDKTRLSAAHKLQARSRIVCCIWKS